MEKVKKKKKFTLKKVKKAVQSLWKRVANAIKSVYKQFMSLPSHIRKIIYVWTIIIIVILLLALLSTNNTEHLNKYANIEMEMNKSAIDYVETNDIIPNEENKLKLDLNVLKDFNYIYDDVITDPTCEGFSVVYYNETEEAYIAKSYINCKKYTTKGYSDYK